MRQFKTIFEASETSIGNWPSHCLKAENLQEARDGARKLTPPAGAEVLKILINGMVQERAAVVQGRAHFS